MDSEILFWLFLAAIYILQALASKKKKSGPQTGDGPVEGQREMPSELEEALGEIGRVLRGEVEEQPAPAPARQTPARKERTLPEPHYQVETEERAPLQPEWSGKARTPGPAAPVDLGGRLAKSPIFYDQAFEDQKADTFKAPIIVHDHQFAFSDPKKPQRTEPHVERPNLRDHLVSRQSFIAAELLAPPLSKRGRKR